MRTDPRERYTPENLARAYMPLARAMAIKHARLHRADTDESIAAAYLGLVKAARKYDRRVPFDIYAQPVVRGALLDELRRGDCFHRQMRKRATRAKPLAAECMPRISLNQPLANGTLPDVAGPEREEPWWHSVSSDSLKRALKSLQPKERAVLGLKYWPGYSQREIADVLDVDQSRVCRLHRQALDKLRVALT